MEAVNKPILGLCRRKMRGCFCINIKHCIIINTPYLTPYSDTYNIPNSHNNIAPLMNMHQQKRLRAKNQLRG